MPDTLTDCRIAAIRAALAKAWDEGHLAGVEHAEDHRVTRANPYREVVVDGE